METSLVRVCCFPLQTSFPFSPFPFPNTVVTMLVAILKGAKAATANMLREFGFGIVLCLLIVFGVGGKRVPALAQFAAERNLDVVLLIDNSGSMEGNDPAGLRWSAAQLFVDLANPGDRVGALAFATDVQPLGGAAAGGLTRIQDSRSRETLKRSLAPRAPEGATNMEAALRQALELLRGDAGGNRPMVVFLTDGRPEPEAQRPRLRDLIRQAGQAGVPVFPILLGSNTDTQVAEQMVHDTGGLRQDVRDAAGLLRAFSKIYTFIRPERYADELQLTRYGLTFRTNPAQAVTQVSAVVPRISGDATAITSLTLDGSEVLGRPALGSGARVARAEATHYQLVTVTHNAAIAGEWNLSPGSNVGDRALLIVSSAITLDLMHPVPSVAGSFVAPRIVPAEKPVLLVARVLQSGGRLGDVPLSATTGAGETVPLEAGGLSVNRDLYWRFLDLGTLEAGQQQRIEVQVGGELTPFRLRKEFVIEGATVPSLVVDSPSAADSGLITGGKLRIAAHFEGDAVSNPAMTAYVHDLGSGEVTVLELQCESSACQDETFTPRPGRAYHVVVVGTARQGGRPFSDGAETELVTGDVMRVDGLDVLSRTDAFPPGQGLQPIQLTVTAFTQSGRPELTAQLASLRPLPPGLSPEALGVVLSPLATQGGNTYSAQLSFVGFDQLPPGEYAATLIFTAPDVTVTPSTVPFRFAVAQPGAHLRKLPNPLDFDLIPDLRRPQVITVEVAYQHSAPFDLAADVVSLESDSGAEHLDLIQVDLGRPSPAARPDYSTVTLRLSALRPLHPGRYRGVIRFRPVDPANPAEVEPPEAAFVFSIPQPALALTRIGPPREPVGCPERQSPRPADLIDFGAFRSVGQPRQVDLFFESTWVRDRPDLEAEIVSLRRAGKPGVRPAPVRLQPGALQRVEEGLYALPLALELPADQEPGTYEGEVSLRGPEVAIQPQSMQFRFDARTTLLGRLRQRVRPGYCMVVDWYALRPFPRFKGILSWLGTFVLVLAGWSIFSSLATGGVSGTVQPASGGPGQQFTARQPAYVVQDKGEVRLSRDVGDAPRALAEIIGEESLEIDLADLESAGGPAALVRPGAGQGSVKLGYWNTRRGKWYKIPTTGKRLRDSDRFAVRVGRRRHEFIILFG